MWVPQLVVCPCGNVFEQWRSGQKYCRPDHRPSGSRPGRKQSSSSLRGYGSEHKLLRAAALAALEPGAPCPRCGDEMYPDQKLHLDHADDDRNAYIGLTHAQCNLRAGAIRGNRLRKRPWWQRERTQLAFPVEALIREAATARSRERRQARQQGKRALSEQVREMRASGMKWQDITDALGLSGPGRAYELAVYYPKRQAQRGQAAQRSRDAGRAPRSAPPPSRRPALRIGGISFGAGETAGRGRDG